MLIAGAPLGHFGVPGDVAPAVAFLASVEAAWITGVTLRVACGVRQAAGRPGAIDPAGRAVARSASEELQRGVQEEDQVPWQSSKTKLP